MLDLVLPRRCVLCRVPGPGVCPACAARLEPPAGGTPAGLDGLVVLCGYSGSGRDLVLALKRRNRRDAVDLLGGALADGLAGLVDADGTCHVTWPPTTRARRRSRGFDQAQLLALATARAGGWPVGDLLRRRGGAQHGGTRVQRWAALSFVGTTALLDTVVVVDDVVASGATMAAAAQALRVSGARRVLGAAVATSALRGDGA